MSDELCRKRKKPIKKKRKTNVAKVSSFSKKNNNNSDCEWMDTVVDVVTLGIR